MSADTVRFSDGAETTLARWGKRGPLVLGIHGVGSSRFGWARIAEHLAERFRTVAYDQRGHGDSTVDGPMTLRRTLDDLAAVVSSLGEPVYALLGHSWGGALAVAGGRELPVERVVAIDPMLHVEAGVWGRGALAEYRRICAQPLPEREAGIRASLAARPQIEIDAKLHATRRLRFAPIDALGEENGIDEGRWNVLPLLADYPKPLLLALADVARTVVLDVQRREIAARAGAQVRIEVFPGASHSLQRDAFDRFIPVCEEFLTASR